MNGLFGRHHRPPHLGMIAIVKAGWFSADRPHQFKKCRWDMETIATGVVVYMGTAPSSSDYGDKLFELWVVRKA